MSLKLKELDAYLNKRNYTLITKECDKKHPLPRFTIVAKADKHVVAILHGDFVGHLECFAKIEKNIMAKICDFAMQSDPNAVDTVNFNFKATELDDKNLTQYLTKDILKFTPEFQQTHQVASSKDLNFVLNHLRRQAESCLKAHKKANN